MKKKRKILFIANKIPPYRLPLFKELSKKFNITFFLTDEEKTIKNFKSKQIISKGKGFGKFKIHFNLVKEIKKENYDYVLMLPPDAQHLINNYLIYFACKKNKIPFIIWTERWQYFDMPIRDKISNFFHKFLLKKAEKVLVTGQKSKEWVKSCGVLESKIAMAPNASEIESNKKNSIKIKKEIIKNYSLKNKKIILYLGRLIKRKGIKYLIEAFFKIDDKNTILIIAGGGDFYKLGEKNMEFELKKQVKDLKLENKIIFTGEINHSDTAAYYSLADVFVYPSITEGISEPWGLTLNEAMQFGLPIVSTDAVGAAYDLIEEGKNGYMVKEKNVDELKNAIEKILKDKKTRNKMGKKSKEIIQKRNNYQIMLKGFLEVFE
jgi:glycosyltransferase involved in cell wall biosynthesis